MTTQNVSGDSPCWYLPVPGDADDREWIAHYATSTEADEDRDQGEPKPVQYQRRCIELTCNNCGRALGIEGELEDSGVGMHIDPADLNDWLGDGWTVLDRDVHYCPECPAPEDEEDIRRTPGPDDVPLFEAVD